ncbi:MAG: hypothetical protein D6695_11100 [Planctomycetota bacterium]|nr:MAG: hypothetical protein D6695_11100 [Planctomycetota bacterium]
MALLAVLTLARMGTAHPQDGPHADIRVSIDETGVHFGMMINLVFIDEIVNVPRESPDAVHPIEEEALREALERFFAEKNVVEIDGVEVSPIFRSFEMIRGGLDELALFPKSGMRGLLRARIELEYPGKGAPRSVRFVWGAYPPNTLLDLEQGVEPPPMTVEMQVSAEGRVHILQFTQDEPEVTWHGTGLSPEQRFQAVPEVKMPEAVPQFPALALGIAVAGLGVLLAGVRTAKARPAIIGLGAALLVAAPLTRSIGTIRLGPARPALPTEAEARAIFEPLHANIYRAFDYEKPGQIYDALARSVDGELLEQLYDQIYTSLIMFDQGGAVSRVSAVRLMRVDIKSIGYIDDGATPGFTLEAQWQVDGVVYHGHTHRRTNEYVAEYSVALRPAGWRISGNRVLSQERLDPDTGKRPRPIIPDGEI